MTGIQRLCKLSLLILSLSFLLPSHLYSETLSSDIEKADRLGDEFQQQMPWSKEKIPSGEPLTRDLPQPPESQRSKDESEPQWRQYPLCYNPYTLRYEYCYLSHDNLNYYDYYKYRTHRPGFYLYWGHGGKCPPGYYFSPERGCYQK